MNALRKLAFFALLLSISAIVLVWRFPASAVLAFVPSQSMSQLNRFVALHEANGTLWSGSARFTTSATPATLQLAWRCTPQIASLALDCTLAGAANGRIRVHPVQNSATIESLQVQHAINVSPNANVSATSDALSLTLARGSVSRQTLALEGSVVARDASYRVGATSTELGEVFIDCKPAADNATTNCTIKNRASAAKLDGTITLSAQRANGSIELSPPGGGVQRFNF
jgi:Type II secretion system (T2SS), protein N